MTIQLMARVYYKEVDPTAQRVLLLLADMANQDNYCWPSIGYIAWALGVGEQAVRRAIRKLEERGTIIRHVQPGRSNGYTIILDTLPDKQPWKGRRVPTPVNGDTPVAGDTPITGDTPTPITSDTPTPITGDTPPLSPVIPITPKEPVVEPSKEPPGRTAARRPAVRPLPDDFRVTPEMREWARQELGVSDVWIDAQTEEFRDYWRGEGRTKADWIATWRNSLRKALERRGAARPAGSARTGPRRDDDTAERWFGRYARPEGETR